jgi:Zn-dependent protease
MPLLWAFMTLQGLTFGFNRYGLVAVSYFALLYGPVLWGTVLVHELGHAFVARRHGIPCSHILLWPLGGLAVLGPGSSPITANIDLKVALAGPFTHLPQFLIWYLVTFAFPGVSWGHTGFSMVFNSFVPALCYAAMEINMYLFAFNLFLPCYPLDGGRVLVALLLLKGMAVESVAKVCVFISGPIAIFICVFGFYSWAVLCVFVGIWMVMQVYQMWVLLQNGQIRMHPMFANAPAATTQPSAA